MFSNRDLSSKIEKKSIISRILNYLICFWIIDEFRRSLISRINDKFNKFVDVN